MARAKSTTEATKTKTKKASTSNAKKPTVFEISDTEEGNPPSHRKNTKKDKGKQREAPDSHEPDTVATKSKSKISKTAASKIADAAIELEKHKADRQVQIEVMMSHRAKYEQRKAELEVEKARLQLETLKLAREMQNEGYSVPRLDVNENENQPSAILSDASNIQDPVSISVEYQKRKSVNLLADKENNKRARLG
ncbi:hypothetical protein FRC02_009932 [Tulasnella sp. 418]|nr:hypothetical protein FRC02_009932 [Tulasnella sp. 418]